MPIYAFACDTCAHQFERLQRLADADPVECPECAEQTVRRQLTAPSFRLAGAGWYETDFKKDGDKKRNLAEKAESSGSETVTPVAAKTEAKPEAAKAPAKPDASPAAKPAAPSPAPAKPATTT